jgi:hypothetical protein
MAAISVLGLLLLFFNWYAHQIASLSKHTDLAADARAKRLAALSKPKTIARAQPAPSPTDGRAIAPATFQVEDLAVGVSAARVGPIQLVDNRFIAGEYLTLQLRITNLGKVPFDYKSWSQRKTGVIIHDRNWNYYNRVMIQDPPIIEQTILPGQTIVDIIAFEAPLNQFGYLALDLPSHTYIPHRFYIPAGFVQQVQLPRPPLVTDRVPPPPAPPPPPPAFYDPEADPQVRSRVITDFRRGAGVVERKINGMGYDRGRKYRTTGYNELIEELARNYNLSDGQVRRIVGR